MSRSGVTIHDVDIDAMVPWTVRSVTFSIIADKEGATETYTWYIARETPSLWRGDTKVAEGKRNTDYAIEDLLARIYVGDAYKMTFREFGHYVSGWIAGKQHAELAQ